MGAVSEYSDLGRVVKPTDYLYIIDADDGSSKKVLIGDVLGGWRDLRAPLIGGKNVGVSDPVMTSFGPGGSLSQNKFAVGNEVMLAFHIDHDIKVASTVFPHVHWSTDGSDVNSVIWEINMSIAARNDTVHEVFSAETQYIIEDTPQGSLWEHIVSEDVTGFMAPEVDALVLINVKRVTNGATENTDGIFGLFVDLHYETQQYGTPSRSPDYYTV
jgi:hypothetical protein